MNKLARAQTGNSLKKALSKTAVEKDLSNTELLFLKRKMENEIRVKLAEFASEIANVRKQKENKNY